MFGYCYSLGFKSGLGVGYKPYINYTWSMLPNGQVQNIGNSGTNLQLYSGNPLDFQGSQYIATGLNLSQTFTVSLRAYNCINGYILGSAYSLSERFYFFVQGGYYSFRFGNSSSIISNIQTSSEDNIFIEIVETSYTIKINDSILSGTFPFNADGVFRSITIGADIAGANNLDGQLDYLTISDRVLTQEEIALSNSNPNAFYDSMVNDANTLFATDFRGTAGYIADDKNKVVGSELVTNGDFSDGTTGWITSTWYVENEQFISDNASDTWRQNITVNNGTYKVSAFISINQTTSLSNSSLQIFDGTTDSVLIDGAISVTPYGVYSQQINGTREYSFIVNITSGTLRLGGYSADKISIDNISVKEISAVYPITNYSETMRTNFQQEPTGLQDLTRSFDSLGFYTGVTDYLKGNGVGYGDTGWVPSADEDWTLEVIIELFDNSASDTTMGCAATERVFISQQSNARLKYAIGDMTSSYTSLFSFGDFISLTLVYYNSGNVKAYENGILTLNVSSTLTQPVTTFRLLTEEYFNKKLLNKIKLFKVHQKVLTQEEITNNYNDYVAQGLLQ